MVVPRNREVKSVGAGPFPGQAEDHYRHAEDHPGRVGAVDLVGRVLSGITPRLPPGIGAPEIPLADVAHVLPAAR